MPTCSASLTQMQSPHSPKLPPPCAASVGAKGYSSKETRIVAALAASSKIPLCQRRPYRPSRQSQAPHHQPTTPVQTKEKFPQHGSLNKQDSPKAIHAAQPASLRVTH